MSSILQIEANRRNAKRSTGPRTAAGKAASARNAVRHNLAGKTFVLLPGEDQAAFHAMLCDYRDEWMPQTAHENFLVNTMVQAAWKLDRIARMQADSYDCYLNLEYSKDKTDEQAVAYLGLSPDSSLQALERYAQLIERTYYRAVRELRTYRRDQQKTTKPVQAVENKRADALNPKKRIEANPDLPEPVQPPQQRPGWPIEPPVAPIQPTRESPGA